MTRLLESYTMLQVATKYRTQADPTLYSLAHPEWPGFDRIRHADVVEIESLVLDTLATFHVPRLDTSGTDIIILEIRRPNS